MTPGERLSDQQKSLDSIYAGKWGFSADPSTLRITPDTNATLRRKLPLLAQYKCIDSGSAVSRGFSTC